MQYSSARSHSACLIVGYCRVVALVISIIYMRYSWSKEKATLETAADELRVRKLPHPHHAPPCPTMPHHATTQCRMVSTTSNRVAPRCRSSRVLRGCSGAPLSSPCMVLVVCTMFRVVGVHGAQCGDWPIGSAASRQLCIRMSGGSNARHTVRRNKHC